MAETRLPGGALPRTASDRIEWLRLIRSHRVGPQTFHRLVSEHGSVGAALNALPGIAANSSMVGYAPCPRDAAAREFDAGMRCGARLVCHGEAAYPLALMYIADAPPVLWALGDLRLAARPCVALIGARNASSLGLRMARRLAAALGEARFVTVSGLARGIDAAAHGASLATGTIAVMAGGIDRIYPAENVGLAADIARDGLLLSERVVGYHPQARDFPRRNRIVSGLAQAVVVVEGAARSGSLITARTALDQGREVMAVPGHPMDARASGCNMLIRDGAALVRGADDVIAALASPPGGAPPTPAPVPERNEASGLRPARTAAPPRAPAPAKAPVARAAQPVQSPQAPPPRTHATRAAQPAQPPQAPARRAPRPEGPPHEPFWQPAHSAASLGTPAPQLPLSSGPRQNPTSDAAQPFAAPDRPTPKSAQPLGPRRDAASPQASTLQPKHAAGAPRQSGPQPAQPPEMPRPNNLRRTQGPQSATPASLTPPRGPATHPVPGSRLLGGGAPQARTESPAQTRTPETHPAVRQMRPPPTPSQRAIAPIGTTPSRDRGTPPAEPLTEAPPARERAHRRAPSPPPRQHTAPCAPALPARILDLLSVVPVAEDQLIRDLGLPTSDVARAIVGLELEGRVLRRAGGLLVLCV